MKKLMILLATTLLFSVARAQKHQFRATATAHSASLSWTASTSAAGCVSPCTFGYNVYRGTSAGGENMVTPINSAPVSGTTFSDTNVALGNTYFYVIQAVETSGALTLTSVNSNEASAVFPAAPTPPSGLAATPN